MKKTLFILFTIAIALSCQTHITEEQQTFGSISVSVDNAPTVEVITRADAVSADDFNVYISSESANYTYIYKEIPNILTVPAGTYTVRAESVTEAVSLSKPDIWGQARYYGVSETKEILPGTTTAFHLTCTIANTAVSVVFDSTIPTYFKNYSVTVYTTEDRQLVYTPENTSSETPAVGYFSPGTITYLFTATFMDEDTPRTIYGTKIIQAATHQYLTFKVNEQESTVDGIEITVDSTCQDFHEGIIVDPTDDSFITE